VKFTSANDLLDFAISEELKAADFYRSLAEKMDRPWMKKTFLDFAQEELGHKAILEGLKDGGDLSPLDQQIPDMKILETVSKSPDENTDDLNYKDALLIAMKAEKEAFMLYSSLADMTADERSKSILNRLAQEEAKHKLRFELEYDEIVLREN